MKLTDDAAKGLEYLFRFKPDNQWLYAWAVDHNPDTEAERVKRTHWSTSVKGIIDDLTDSPDGDAYLGMTVASKRGKPSRRILATQSAGAGFIWVDLDAKAGAFGSIPEIIAGLKGQQWLPFSPDLIVESGGGVHAYWTLDEWEEFETDEQREAFSGTVRAVQQGIAAASRLKVDSTHDLSRVLRVPGTFNFKTNPPQAVRIHELTAGNGISLSGVNEWVDGLELPEAERTVKVATSRVADGMTLDPEAVPPFQLFEALRMLNPKFAGSWANDRPDLTDQSPSSFDFSLAAIALQHDWTDQQIADLLIAHRRQHGHPLKLDRRDNYYLRSIEAARKALATSRNVNPYIEPEIPIESPDGNPDRSGGLSGTMSAERLATAGAALGIPLEAIFKHGDTEAIYFLTVGGERVELGGVANLTSQSAFRNRILETCNKLPRKVKGDKWELILVALTACIQTVRYDDTGPLAKLWGFISRYTNRNMHPRQAAIIEGLPILEGDDVFINVPHFETWIAEAARERVQSHALRAWLDAAGFVRREIKVRDAKADGGDGRVRKRWYYRIQLERLEAEKGIADEPDIDDINPPELDGETDLPL